MRQRKGFYYLLLIALMGLLAVTLWNGPVCVPG